MSRLLTTIGNNVRKYRLEKKLTQKQLAKRANLSQSYISVVENAKVNLYLHTLYRIAKGLGIKARYLVE